MKKKVKIKSLKLLSDNLTRVDRRKKNKFVCPTCLKEIELNDSKNISEAHIIPKAAKGTLKTFLCRKCNSIFGSKQDKWFGEIINLYNSSKPLVETELMGRHFIFGDRKVAGKWLSKDNGDFAFLFYKDKNSPGDFEYYLQYCKNTRVSFSIEYPIMKQESLIQKGYMTAAYLFYFRIFGYSWVLQKHLDSIRESILDNKSDFKNSCRFLQFDNVNWRPWIGTMQIDDDVLLVMGLNDILTVFPTYSIKNLDEYFKNINLGETKKHFRTFGFELHNESVPAQILTYYDKPLILSDATQSGLSDNFMVQLLTKEGIKNLYPTTDEEIIKLENDDSIILNKLLIKA